MQHGCCAGASTPTVRCVSFFVGLQRDGVPHYDRPPPPVPRASCAVRCRRALRCAVRSSQPIRRSRARSAPARAPANCCSVLLPVCDPPAGSVHCLCLCRPARLRPCRSRLAGNTPGAEQQPAPMLCRSAYQARALLPRLPGFLSRGLLPARLRHAVCSHQTGARRQPPALPAAARLWPCGLLCVQCG